MYQIQDFKLQFLHVVEHQKCQVLDITTFIASSHILKTPSPQNHKIYFGSLSNACNHMTQLMHKEDSCPELHLSQEAQFSFSKPLGRPQRKSQCQSHEFGPMYNHFILLFQNTCKFLFLHMKVPTTTKHIKDRQCHLTSNIENLLLNCQV